MSYSPCVIIPVYNHDTFIAQTLQSVLSYGVHVFMVNDGSHEICRKILETLVGQHKGAVTLISLPENRGKGAAVMAGFEAAYETGYSHALQIDADGQHDPKDIPLFMERTRAHPDEVVTGKPIYDDSVPKSRLYGRYVTHFWVWVETLSFEIKDSMCGFRMYPLTQTVDLIRHVKIGARMDFDIDILVRLYWAGVPVSFIDTRVIYPDHGVSHFDVLADNIRISKIHTILFFGMLKRLPMLLQQKWKRARAS